ncbi:HlyD family efflux transporter periplasmic adaptor subunit [Lapidilactobacillus bayanensis]|uniref:HlyD family efflux transporter periplasmic adaptor subunit n=1 Tax=Lapidilactobacillus bayanensis TaxID=2485998 RepID=UPI000F779B45|nr:hypothetical protein [Lapidilactobacillus bayanensis]
MYRAQIKQGNSGDVKKQVAAEIDANSQQVAELINNYQIQVASIDATQASHSGLSDELSENKSEYLTKAQKELVDLNTTKQDLELKIQEAHYAKQDLIVKAPKAGVIHLLNDMDRYAQIPAGTILAELYPVKKVGARIVVNIPATEVGNVKEGEKVHVRCFQKTSHPVELNGHIQQIYLAPVRTKEGNYFKTIVNIGSKNNRLLRQGMQGQVTVITGKKTYFDYYKDRLLNKD